MLGLISLRSLDLSEATFYDELSEALGFLSEKEKSFDLDSAAQKKNIMDEDEILIRSIVFRNSSNFIRRINDDEDEDDLHQSSQKRRTSEIGARLGNPTEILTKTSVCNPSISGGGTAPKPKFIVIPKRGKEDVKETNAPTGLILLSQNYKSNQGDDSPTGLLLLSKNYESDE